MQLVLNSLQRFVGESLRLTVNTQKSAVGRPWERSFLGFTFSRRELKVKVSDKALTKLKATVKQLSRRTRGHSITQIIAELRKSLLGWKAYFDISEILSPLRDLDKWIRRRLRCYILKQWGRKGYRMLRRKGSRPEAGMEYCQVSSWPLAVKWQSGTDQSASQQIFHEPRVARIGGKMNIK